MNISMIIDTNVSKNMSTLALISLEFHAYHGPDLCLKRLQPISIS
jgi:hypothetical protein